VLERNETAFSLVFACPSVYSALPLLWPVVFVFNRLLIHSFLAHRALFQSSFASTENLFGRHYSLPSSTQLFVVRDLCSQFNEIAPPPEGRNNFCPGESSRPKTGRHFIKYKHNWPQKGQRHSRHYIQRGTSAHSLHHKRTPAANTRQRPSSSKWVVTKLEARTSSAGTPPKSAARLRQMRTRYDDT